MMRLRKENVDGLWVLRQGSCLLELERLGLSLVKVFAQRRKGFQVSGFKFQVSSLGGGPTVKSSVNLETRNLKPET